IGAVSHSDSRFAPAKALSIDEIRRTLTLLLRSYINTMDILEIETWIAHGTLLGWYWGRKIFPWDTDIDVQVSAETLVSLANYNMTRFGFEGEEYLLDVNPYFLFISTDDMANKIDARWIDVRSGKYIDITAVHRHPISNILFCKDGHRYTDREIYPLQMSDFEGINIKIPSETETILSEEYKKKALANKNHHWYNFVDKSQSWEPEGRRNSWWIW
ncbi:related to mannosylphosphorylation protein MNN4, partial [Phialocephala subalpina]